MLPTSISGSSTPPIDLREDVPPDNSNRSVVSSQNPASTSTPSNWGHQQLALGRNAAAQVHAQLLQITPLAAADAKAAISKFTTEFKTREPEFESIMLSTDLSETPLEKRTPEEKKLQRVIDTYMTLETFEDGGHLNDENTKIFSCEWNNKLLGLMALKHLEDETDPPSIEVIVSQINSTGAGSRLIEMAVNESQRLGKNGALTLGAKNPDAERAYVSMGFQRIWPKYSSMKLDPSTRPEKWTFSNNQWELTNKRDLALK